MFVTTKPEQQIESPKAQMPESEKFALHRLRVEDYEKMIEYGIFDSDDKIELWEGVLVKISPKGINHRSATTKTTDFSIKI